MKWIPGLILICSGLLLSAAAPPDLTDRFELPSGFRIFKIAGPDVTGGSYALTFDGQGRLLVGDGRAVRRLQDRDRDGVFESYETVATGLGWRGPQGLLVYGDQLWAVGGDGVQIFDGYSGPGPLRHRGRVGAPFNTGGDHDAHTLLRGHDGFVYLVCGDGSGVADRRHITEITSPRLFERAASVFRISPEGLRWECLSAGGRNPPNLGLHPLGDFFSLDSDMEWHVGLPFYRPVRLNHWMVGGDLGWQEVGAYPGYYPDNLPGILEVGRGSPNWGTFYEHQRFPARYHGNYFVADYRWKMSSTDRYNRTGRLLAYSLQPHGASWRAGEEIFARPKPDAKDDDGRPIQFALVDVVVAPDGSLILSEHNQGLWRIASTSLQPAQTKSKKPLDRLLSLPQPGAEWSRLEAAEIRRALGKKSEQELQRVALNGFEKMERRLSALRYLSPDFHRLEDSFLSELSRDTAWQLRAQAAWLIGLKGGGTEAIWTKLLNDQDAFVRRRAAESLSRSSDAEIVSALIQRLNDRERVIRFAAMNALAHRSPGLWLEKVLSSPLPAVRMRGLLAMNLRREKPGDEKVQQLVRSLLPLERLAPEDQLDFLRILALAQTAIDQDPTLALEVRRYLLRHFPGANPFQKWEAARLMGLYAVPEAFDKLLSELQRENDQVTQFHLASSLARLTTGWSEESERRAWEWFLSTQKGWFAELADKGVEFPQFWATTVDAFVRNHRKAALDGSDKVEFGSIVGAAVLRVAALEPGGVEQIMGLYEKETNAPARRNFLAALQPLKSPALAEWLRSQFDSAPDVSTRGQIIRSLAGQVPDPANREIFVKGLSQGDSEIAQVSIRSLLLLAPQLDLDLAKVLVRMVKERRSVLKQAHDALHRLAGVELPSSMKQINWEQRVDDPTRIAIGAFWEQWFEKRFQQKLGDLAQSMSDGEAHAFIAGPGSRGGNVQNGLKVYETLQCQNCHGGGKTPGREGTFFGPELGGIGRRLSRTELADSLIYPSKTVAERFKTWTVELKDGMTVDGFLTEENAAEVTLAAKDQVLKFPRSSIKTITPQSTSLMPDQLLNRLSLTEIRDLVAFLESAP